MSRTRFKPVDKDSVSESECDPHHQAQNTLSKAQLTNFRSDEIPLCILTQSQRASSAMASDTVPCDCARLMLVFAAAIVYVQGEHFSFPSFATFGKAYFLIVFLLCTRSLVASHIRWHTSHIALFSLHATCP